MAHGLNSIKRAVASANNCTKNEGKGIGSRRIFAPHFKLQVLDSYRNDADCKGNQRATARKYGIHRRQIQKWLQVENALRSSVNSAKEKSDGATEQVRKCSELGPVALSLGRQRDDEPAPAHSPAAAPWLSQQPPLPLDFTTHGRVACDHSVPIDLSLKRPAVSPALYAPPTPPTTAASPCLAPQRHDPDVWDLSTKGLKRSAPTLTSPKPVKLFKPYLDDVGVVKQEPTPPCCAAAATQPCDAFYYNNNNVCEAGGTYTLLELQPKTALSYYYPPYPTYPEYESYCVYEDISYGQGLAPLKQRQSYSLDFKLSAIDCYYQDSACKGNQRAVASKYNVHRRQVQKWLKQAEELRLRNETVKQTHAVR